MGTECYLTVSMKQVLLLLFCLTLVSTEWTCDDCKVAGPWLGKFSSSPESIEYEAGLLTAEICPQSENVDECVERLPAFWGALAVIILPELYSHVCNDIPCDDQSPVPSAIQPRIPTCDECTSRVNMATDHLGHDAAIEYWITSIGESEFCPEFVAEHDGWATVEKCQEVLPKFLPLALKFLAKANRDWIEYWCSQFGSC